MAQRVIAQTHTPVNTGDSWSGGTSVNTNTWQRATGHYENFVPFPAASYDTQAAADTDDHAIYPRPDSETDSNARHRWAHDQMIYEVPVYARGGGFPYHAEVDETNTSAALLSYITITNDWTNRTGAKSCYVQITAAGIQTLAKDGTAYDIYIKLHDQNGNKLKFWWSFKVEVNANDHFIFYDNASTTGSYLGTWANPYRDIDDVDSGANYLTGTGANTANKIVVLKEGNSQTPASEYTKSDDWITTTTAFPIAMINNPADTNNYVIDCDSTYTLFHAVAADITDLFYWGGECINGRKSSEIDGHAVFNRMAGGDQHRIVLANFIFDGVAQWPATTFTNNAVLTTGTNSAGAYARQHLAFSDIQIKNVEGSGLTTNTGGMLMAMGIKNALIDNWRLSDIGLTATTPHLMHFKHKSTQFTARRITAEDNINNAFPIIQFDYDNVSGFTAQDIEICYSSSNGNSGWGKYLTQVVNTGGTNGGPIYIYRSSGRNGGIALGADASYELKGNATTVSNEITGGAIGNVTETQPSYDDVLITDFDGANLLLDAWHTTNSETRGTVGHEIT